MVSVTVFPQSKMHPAGSPQAPPCASCPWACGPLSPGPLLVCKSRPSTPKFLGVLTGCFFFFCLHVLACKDQTRTLYVGSVES